VRGFRRFSLDKMRRFGFLLAALGKQVPTNMKRLELLFSIDPFGSSLANNRTNELAPDEMGLQYERNGADCRVLVSGRITIDTSPELRSGLMQRVQSKECGSLTVDLYSVDYVDSSGLAILLEVLKAARLEGKRFLLSRLRDRPRYLLETTRLMHLFESAE
jgi:anti-sigma B factor antagonist